MAADRELAPVDKRPGSVRVEVDATFAGSAESIVLPEATAPSKSVLLLLMMAVAGLIVTLIALRPPADEAADGAPRVQTSVPTTTTPAAEERHEEETADVVATGDGTLEVVATTGTGDVAGIVRAEVGFLALQWRTDDGLSDPPILRSLDGITWDSVDTTIVGLPDGNLVAPSFRQFTNLIRLDDGFAMMAITTTFTDNDTSDPTHTLLKLSSETGSVWSPDPEFEQVESSTSYPWVGSHTADAFVFVDSERWSGDEFAAVVREETHERLEVGMVCGAEASRTYIRIYRCEEPPLSLTPENVVAPESFDALGECLVQLTNQRYSPADLRFVGRQGAASRPLTELGLPISSPASFDGGTVVSIDIGSEIRRGQSSCEAFLPIRDAVPAAVLIWEPDAEVPTRVDIPETALSAAELLNVRVEPAVVGRTLVVFAGDALWEFDIDSLAWTKLLDTPGPIVDPTTIALSNDGSIVLLIGRGFLGIGDTRTDRWEWRGLEVFADFPSIIYSDEATAFIQGNGEMVKITLPPR